MSLWRLDPDLKEKVEKFLAKEPLNDRELNDIKDHIISWIASFDHLIDVQDLSEFDKDYKERINSMDQEDLLEFVNDELMEEGIEPF